MEDTKVSLAGRIRKQFYSLSGNGRLLLTFALVNGVALMSVGSLVSPYLRNLGMSPAFIGTYFAISAVAQAVASFSGGFLADAFGRRRIWILGKLMQVASYLLLASGLRAPYIVLAPVLAGMSQIGSGAYLAFRADAVPSGNRATFFSVVQTLDAVSGIVAPLLGGLVADTWGAPVAFLLVVPMIGLAVLTISRMHEAPRLVKPEMATASAREPLMARISRFFSRQADGIMRGPYPRTARAMLAYNVINGVSNGLISLALPLVLRDRFGIGYAGIGGAQTAISLGTATMMIVGGRMADKRGRRSVMVWATALMTVAFVPFLFVTAAWQLYALLVLVPMFGNAASGAFGATQMEAVSPGIRAAYGGACQGLSAAGMAIGSVAGGLLYAVSPNLAMGSAIGCCAAGLLIIWAFVEETSKPARQAAPSPSSVAELVEDAAI